MPRRAAIAAKLASVTLALLGTPPVLGQSAGDWNGPSQLWRATCSYCHNERLAPELRAAGVSAQDLIVVVRKGPNAMPSFARSVVSDTELEQLARWLATQQKPSPAQAGRGGRTPRHESRERPQ